MGGRLTAWARATEHICRPEQQLHAYTHCEAGIRRLRLRRGALVCTTGVGVNGLEVAMEDVSIVKIGHAARHIEGDVQKRAVPREQPRGARVQQLQQITLHELGHQRELAISVAGQTKRLPRGELSEGWR